MKIQFSMKLSLQLHLVYCKPLAPLGLQPQAAETPRQENQTNEQTENTTHAAESPNRVSPQLTNRRR